MANAVFNADSKYDSLIYRCFSYFFSIFCFSEKKTHKQSDKKQRKAYLESALKAALVIQN